MEWKPIWLAVSQVLACACAPGATFAADVGPAGAPYDSAQACAKCHPAIHGYWAESEHARSATNPAFLGALRAAVETSPDKDAVRNGCVWCHAPTAIVTGDQRLEQPVTREGVTCDFCHTVADVDLGARGHPFRLEPGPVKRGPLEFAKSPAHENAYSALHRTSPLLCAACHQFTNALGVEVLSTYSEWKASPYPERGQTCQECHMPLVPGWSVAEGLDASRRRINLHRVEGGSSAGRLATGLDLRFESVLLRTPAEVDVAVVNRAVGHAAPSGLSSKRLVLGVGVDTGSGELRLRRDRVYRRSLRDDAGRDLVAVADLFLKARSVGEDTRLRPRETRLEHVTVPLPDDWVAIVARLEYVDATGAEPRITPVREVRWDRR
ncbi:MAG TPA: multiheme c-type cytochrome [Vicinamibacteria bacterium]